MDLFFNSDMVDRLLKTNVGRDRKLSFVGRQLFCDLVRYHFDLFDFGGGICRGGSGVGGAGTSCC